MSEDGITDGAGEPAPLPTPAAPQSYIDGEGNFTEGWQEHYVPEDVREDAIIGRMKSIQGLFKTVANFDRMKGADKINKPSDSFGDADWDAYHAAGGWTNEPIGFNAPEGIPDGIWNEDRAKEFSEVMNKLRLTPKQQAGLNEAYNKDLLLQLTNQNNIQENSMAELKAGLISEWGNDYTRREHLGNVAVEKGTGGDAEFKERILLKFGNDPDFIKYSSNLGGHFSESGDVPVVKPSLTPNDIQTKITEVQNSDAFKKPMHPDHKTAMQTVARLYKEKNNVRVPA